MSEELATGPKESPPAPRAGPREVWKKGGRLLSVLLAVNVLLLACTLISGSAFNKVAVYDTDVFALLTTMMLLAVLWILFYLLRTVRCPGAVPYRDAHAGPIWLRGGLVLFGICTLVMDVFKTGYYSSFFECQSAIKILHPLTQAVFVIVQTYFLWVSAKDCIHTHLDLTRCGLMFTLTTNLAIWMAAVVDESVHQAHSHSSSHGNTSYTRLTQDWERAGSAAGGDCSCNTAVCQVFQQGYFYLYPFNIEYSLFASTMLYVMWKNVGRLLASSTHGHSHTPSPISLFRETFFVGPILGLILFVVGLAVFIIYEVQVSGETGRTQQALVIYYIFNIVCLGLMTLVSLSGSVIYRFDRRAMDHHKNPTRTLDVALLMGAALGQYAISYYSIVAVVVGTPRDLLAGLNLAHALLMIAQHIFQNVFIIESLHRGPPGDETHGTPPREPCQGLTFANLDALHTLPACPPPAELVGPSPAGPQEAVSITSAPKDHWRSSCGSCLPSGPALTSATRWRWTSTATPSGQPSSTSACLSASSTACMLSPACWRSTCCPEAPAETQGAGLSSCTHPETPRNESYNYPFSASPRVEFSPKLFFQDEFLNHNQDMHIHPRTLLEYGVTRGGRPLSLPCF
ncbi:proton channel OTOP2 isoform X1 [Camelus bactrianus]|uniref:Proton channel OTOP2 isoform X1 n=1 Tax=Camelus bactrianus TaxID=9837 RepID=A0A9W3FZ29_CAMBA|nr:proton channel OTOP2 isoform X1 [Camelus bactrianus]